MSLLYNGEIGGGRENMMGDGRNYSPLRVIE